jgi:sugar-specific transcriptional regulator TrmB
MNFIKRDAISPDKYDIFIQRIDSFQSLVEEKKRLQAEISQIQTEYMEKIRPLEDEFATVIKKLETTLAKLEGTSASPAPSTIQKFSRGQLGVAIKELLRTNADRNFKPREIAEALDTKGTTVSVWFNKYGVGDSEIERIPSGKDGKRYVYRIK